MHHLYLMRHGEAQKTGVSDKERALTSYGVLQVKAVAEEFRSRKIHPLVVSSPYRRAVETAKTLCDSLEIATFRQDSALASTGAAPDLSAILHTYKEASSLLLIGHQPDLGLLATKLLGFEFGFGTASVMAFTSSEGSEWRFNWTFAPN